MSHYNFKAIEQRWQGYWEQHATFRTEEPCAQPKFYVLDMFPYPSGEGLHVGHLLGYVASDVVARCKRHQGYNVLHPMGFDAFGLPAEQYAIHTGQHPAVTTDNNVRYYQAQLKRMGLSFDWSRGIRTSDPAYYRWTQWIFLQLFHSWYDTHLQKARPIEELIARLSQWGNVGLQAACDEDTPVITAEHWQRLSEKEQQTLLLKYRLAFLEVATVNWCPALGTVLANEEVKGGYSERGGHPVVQRKMKQWSLRITAYATRLLEDLKTLDWPTSIKEMQRHWIGQSQGAKVTFQVIMAQGSPLTLAVFTSRPETIFGVTYLALAPEHPLVRSLTIPRQQQAVADYVAEVQQRSERERLATTKHMTGVFTGTYARHPWTQQRLPIWVADYVMSEYGTGVVMGVPAHDGRDHSFAQQWGLPVVQVITGRDVTREAHEAKTGRLVRSYFLNHLTVEEATHKVLDKLSESGVGQPTTTLRLRNAVFSRQRYWGEPIPIYHKEGTPYALPETELPLELPSVDAYQFTSAGEPPLSRAEHWHTASGDPLELSTMPGWAGSSWYSWRYMDPHNTGAFVNPTQQRYWQAVDLYIGGAEHATGHLLYARFWTKFLHDLGYVDTQEPFRKLINQGMIQGRSYFVYRVKNTQQFVSYALKERYDTVAMHVSVDLVQEGVLDIEAFRRWRPELQKATFVLENEQYICGSVVEKMSKSKYNVVNPDMIIAQHGADALRLYMLFLGPLEQSKPWDTHGIEGVSRFLNKLWRLFYNTSGQASIIAIPPSIAMLKVLHKTIKKVHEAVERHAFNTAVSAFMVCVNELTTLSCNHRSVLEDLVVLLAPFAPHVAEELWQHLGHSASISTVPWPQWDVAYLQEDLFEYPITVNGRVRTKLSFAQSASREEIAQQVLTHPSMQKWIQSKQPKKVIVVPQRIVNVVI